MGDIFDLVVVNPFTNALLVLYGVLGSYVLAVIVLTVIIKVSTLPLTIQQQVSSMKMAAMQPKMKEIQDKYKNEPQKLQEEMRKLGYNPLSGCLLMFIQLPIFIGLYQAITRTLGVTPFNLLNLGKHVYSFIPNLSSLVPINSNFLGMDLGQPDKLFIIPILVVATTWFSNKLMTPPATDAQTKQTNQMMQMMMPLMFGFFMLSAPAGLGIYWLVSNLIQVAQYYIMKPRLESARAQYGLPSLNAKSGDSASKAVIDVERPAPPKSRARGSNTARFNTAKPDEKKDK